MRLVPLGRFSHLEIAIRSDFDCFWGWVRIEDLRVLGLGVLGFRVLALICLLGF